MATIFTVDDDRDIMKIYRDVLQMKDHNIVAEALDGEEAVEIFKTMNKCPDIIIMDHRMPTKNGLEAMKDIREINPLQGIIFVTADEIAAKKAMNIGANSFVLKPFRMDNLFNAIETTLSGMREKKTKTRESLLRIVAQIKKQDPDALRRACDQIEKDVINEYIHDLKVEGETDLKSASNWACSFMNIAGFDFKYDELENGDIQIINNKCHWMEKIDPDPVYCHVSRCILTRFALRENQNVVLDVLKTLMNKDDCCHFVLSKLPSPDAE